MFLFLGFLGCAETARQTNKNSSTVNAVSGKSTPHQPNKKESDAMKNSEDEAHAVSNSPKVKNKHKPVNDAKKEAALANEAAVTEKKPLVHSTKPTKKNSDQASIGGEPADEKGPELSPLGSSPTDFPRDVVYGDGQVSNSIPPEKTVNRKKSVPQNSEAGSLSNTEKHSVPFSESLSVKEAHSTAEATDQAQGNLPPEKVRQGKRASKALDAVRKSDLLENKAISSASGVESFFTPNSDEEKTKVGSKSPSQNLLEVESKDQTLSSGGEASPVLDVKMERISSEESVNFGSNNSNSLELGFSSSRKSQPAPIKDNIQARLGYSNKSDGLEAGLRVAKAKSLGWRMERDGEESENQESVSRASVKFPSKPAYLRLQKFIQTSSPDDFSSKKEDREYSKISVWAESQADRNRTSVDARRSQDKRFGKALQWIRDKGRKQMDAPADED